MDASEDIFQPTEDIPGKWQTDSFLGAVLRVMPGLVYVFNQETMSNEYANRSLGMSLGYSQQDVADMGANLMPTICHPDDLAKVMAHLQKIRDLDDTDFAELEYRVRHKDGHFVWLLSHDTVFERDCDGKVIRHIGNASDITRQKVSEEHALHETRLAMAATNDLRAFAYSVSHDMRSPSNTLLMLLSELMDQHGDQMPVDAQYLLDLASDCVCRMQDKIDDVLDLTQLLDRSSERVPVPLNDVMAAVRQDMGADIKACAATVTVATLPVVTASHSQMCTLFQKLTSNAVKFRDPDRAPAIHIWDSSPSPDDDHVEITVRDNGIGIPEADRAQIFEMFKRLHLQVDFAGNGLGLAMCRRIATSHGGDISVDAAPDQGSDFKVRLKR